MHKEQRQGSVWCRSLPDSMDDASSDEHGQQGQAKKTHCSVMVGCQSGGRTKLFLAPARSIADEMSCLPIAQLGEAAELGAFVAGQTERARESSLMITTNQPRRGQTVQSA